jgi:hypothetical protein
VRPLDDDILDGRRESLEAVAFITTGFYMLEFG